MNTGDSHNKKTVVLIVNDQKMICEVVRRMLQTEEDIEFHFCLEGAKAIEKAIEISPTVILQDLIMPDIDGLTLLKEYRHNSKTKHIPVIVLSSEENTQIKADAFALDANDYLNKIPDKIELLARLRHHSKGYLDRLDNEAQNIKLQKYKEKIVSDLIMYQKILEDQNIAFMLLGKTGNTFNVINLNLPMEKLLEKSKAEVIGHPTEAVIPQEITQSLLETMNKVKDTDKPEIFTSGIPSWNKVHITRSHSGEIIMTKAE